MDVTKISELIGEVGLPIVCSALVVILFVRFVKRQQDWFDKLMSILVNKAPVHHLSPDEDEVLSRINDKIATELHGVLQRLSSDRAYVFLYHNGGVSSSGLCFSRMSCISEVVSSGTLPISSDSQALHKGPYSRFCNALKYDGCSLIDDVEDLKDEDTFIHHWLKSQHVMSKYCFILKDSSGMDIGFLGVDYCSYNEDISQEEIINCLTVSSHRVSSLVDVRSEVVE